MPPTWCGITATCAWPSAEFLELQGMAHNWVVLSKEEEGSRSWPEGVFNDEDKCGAQQGKYPTA